MTHTYCKYVDGRYCITDDELMRLRAEVEALRHGLIAIKAHQEMVGGGAARYGTVWQIADVALRIEGEK